MIAGQLPMCLRNAYFDKPPVIDLATQQVDIHTEQSHYRCRIEPVARGEVAREETTQEKTTQEGTARKFRFIATPEQNLIDVGSMNPGGPLFDDNSEDNTTVTQEEQPVEGIRPPQPPGMPESSSEDNTAVTQEGHQEEHQDDLISFQCLEYVPDDTKLEKWLDAVSAGGREEAIWGLYNMYKMHKTNENDENWKNLQNHALDFLIRKMEPDTKLSLLSVGVGIKNKRLFMPKEDYHWGYLNLMVPSPWNQFFSFTAALASAQADRATEETKELAALSEELNFHRIDPGVLSINRFNYSLTAIVPALKDTIMNLLEHDLSKLEVKEDVEVASEWLFRHWILGDDMYRALTDGSSDRPDFPTSVESKANMPLTLVLLLPDREKVIVQVTNDPSPIQRPANL
ncbi:hypothetical protein C2W62_02525 [Candidatus Entotheonella serta]|nr:hypothetical protein C2W62_02525 [Candidatus Entotheonella serta]